METTKDTKSTESSENPAKRDLSEAVGSADLCAQCGEMPKEHFGLCFNCANDIDEEDMDDTCPNCHGTGGEPLDDGITPCSHCMGMGYEFWR